ncbi:hypothetical protein PFMALIP_01609 [Plasmodium falciparum MaliPS096_E11]|uniref:Uncharacterized protein n=1 Tax=Plasmodium falciparum MaliPS096_E11 TaxID=1036727 RepID=A0A024WV57_PLAFA|nr:hypothetical protein PFMALIP_01609 [Plasmodium falciparum MaliPS096_E11]
MDQNFDGKLAERAIPPPMKIVENGGIFGTTNMRASACQLCKESARENLVQNKNNVITMNKQRMNTCCMN